MVGFDYIYNCYQLHQVVRESCTISHNLVTVTHYPTHEFALYTCFDIDLSVGYGVSSIQLLVMDIMTYPADDYPADKSSGLHRTCPCPSYFACIYYIASYTVHVFLIGFQNVF